MSIRKLLLAVPFALGIACSHSSKSQTAASGGGSPGAQASSGYGGTIVTTAGAPSTGSDQSGSGSSSSGGSASGSSAGSSEGAQDTQGGGAMGGQMGSGGSSETMGTDKSSQGEAAEGMSQHGGDKKVAGKLSKVSKSEVTVTAKDGTATKLKIADQTIVMMNGKEAKPAQLKQGQPVHASYQEQGDDHVAVKIEVGKHKAQGHHGTPGSSGHTQGSGSSGSGSDMGGSSGSGSDPSK
jgi:hypothetical protein